MIRTRRVRDGARSAREQRHRRGVLLSIGALLLLAMSPLFGHHLARETDALFAGRDHLGTLCLIALHYLAEPIHRVFHALFVAGIVYAAWDRLRAWQRVRRTLAVLPASVPKADSDIGAAARAAELTLSQVRILRGLPTPAFTVGLLRPRVYVAEEIAHALTADELRVVLAHEAEHVRRRDPLRLSLLRFVSHTLFWLPALRRLTDDFADEAEIRADDAACADRPLVLASALLALARWGQPRPRIDGVAFDERDLLERRVRRLVGEETRPGTHLTRRSAVAACAALLLVWASGTAVAHPLPDGDVRALHCAHPNASAWSHLLCRGEAAAIPDVRCPHEGR